MKEIYIKWHKISLDIFPLNVTYSGFLMVFYKVMPSLSYSLPLLHVPLVWGQVRDEMD